MNHEMQHHDSPTWCIHCGTFDIYCDGECDSDRSGKYDSGKPENYARMFREVFGVGLPEAQ
jgi:hypothetical protein